MLLSVGPTVIEFPAPAPLITMNQRHHWHEQRRLTRLWRAAAHQAAHGHIPPGTTLPPSIVAIELPVFGKRRRDPHNYFSTVKPVVDGLVDAGLWDDDTPEWVTTIEPALIPHSSRADYVLNARTRITITPRPVL